MCGQRVLQFISLNTLVDAARVPKACKSGKDLPFDLNFIYICLQSDENLVSIEILKEKYLVFI